MNIASLNPIFANTISLLIMTAVAYTGSLFTWQILDSKEGAMNQIIKPASFEDTATEDAGELLANYPLFGTVPKAAKKQAVKNRTAPKRKKVTAVAPPVAMVVRGILAGNSNFAIIEIARDQGVYAEGDYVSHLFIEKIAEDYVLLDEDGVMYKVFVSDESVSIGGGKGNKHTVNNNTSLDNSQNSKTENVQKNNNQNNNQNNNTQRKIDTNALPTHAPNLSAQNKKTLKSFKKTLRKNPLQVLGKMNAFPHREGGKLVGYKVTPGSERALFNDVGLQAGDIIVNVNGQSLDQIGTFTQGMQFMEQLGKATTLDLLIKRRGVEKRVYLELD